MTLQHKKRNNSLHQLEYTTLRELKEKRKVRKSSQSINLLKNFRTAYEQPFFLKKEHPSNEEQLEEEE